MILDFDMVTLCDFKTYRGEHVFDLTRYGDGLHFMRGVNLKPQRKRMGSNGAGKSTIWEAIIWCLFGETSAGLKNPDVKPWHHKKSTSVGLSICKGKSRHSIVRSISPNRLTIDRRDAGQEQVNELIGMSLELIKNTVFLCQGQDLFFDRTNKDKMQLFVDALDLDRWDNRSRAATERVSKLGNELSEYVGEEASLRSNIITVGAMIDKYKTLAEEWEHEWKDRTRNAQKDLKAAVAKLDDVSGKRDRADLAYESAEVELRGLATQFEKEAEVLELANREFDKADLEDKSNRSACLTLKQKLRDLGDGSKCDMCGQSVKGSNLERHRVELRKALRKREDIVADGIPSKICEAVDRATANLNTTRKHVLDFKRKADAAKDNLDTFDRSYAEWKGKVDAYRAIAESKEEETNPHRATIKDFKKQLADLEYDLDDCVADQRSVNKKMERAKFWTKGFKDIRLFVLEDIMAELDLATNAMLDEAGLIGWRVAFELERETSRGTISRGLQIMVSSPESDGMVKWESWSGGEAQRLRIVGALALSEVLLNHSGVTPSMEVLDEPTQHLSPEGVVDLCEYLSDRATRLRRQVWYVDQQSVESTRFASVTTIRRDDTGSHIVNTGVSRSHA